MLFLNALLLKSIPTERSTDVAVPTSYATM